MSLFFGGKEVEAVLFSPLEGQLTLNGKPASGAKIRLWIKWKDAKGENFFYTADDQGFFHIPEHKTTFKQNPLAQVVITQEIYVDYQDENYLVWTLSKTQIEGFDVLGGGSSRALCELTADLEAHTTDNVLMGTICRWEAKGNKD